MTGETIVITDRNKQEPLIPVITYVPGLRRAKAVAAWLSFLSICHDDCRNHIRLSNALSANDEAQSLRLLDDVIQNYLAIDALPIAVQKKAFETAHKFLAGASPEHRTFLETRLLAICGDHCYRPFWNNFESAACFDDLSRYDNGDVTVLQLKKFADFALAVIALTVLCGCGDGYYSRMAFLEEKMRMKFENGFPLDRLGLYLWPLEFSFVQNDADDDIAIDEHGALVAAARSINPDVQIQACADTLVWSRDVLAWLDDEFDAFVETETEGNPCGFGRGMLNEGGNIITGKAIDKFILVAQGSLPDVSSEIMFRFEMDKRAIQTYVLPDGFVWTRNPVTQKDSIQDSIHIDAVINFVPSACTSDARPRLLIDPLYHAQIRSAPDFTRFLAQQSISDKDIVLVDEKELYLNLPNFSVLLDRNGEKRFLFNKDKGHTLPRLHLKPGLMVQPALEITAMAGFFGALRCATNMLPASFVKAGNSPVVLVSDAFPPETRRILITALHADSPAIRPLAALFVSRLSIQPGPPGIPWEFNEFARTAYIYCASRETALPDQCRQIVMDRIGNFTETLDRQLGMKTDAGANAG